MAVIEQYQGDVDAILAVRYDNGADYWTTPDKRMNKGNPFSTLGSAMLLLELGMPPSDPVLQGVADLFFSTWRKDGRFRLFPDGAIYPCHTINAANVLCHLGHACDSRLQKTYDYLLDTQYSDGGWRCNKFSFGHGPETKFSNPGPTLNALNAFRFTSFIDCEPALDRAVDFLLNHWTVRKPIGPCHYGIGTLFMQVEYPFSNYNLFLYVYVLSFYHRSHSDPRFLEALSVLESKLENGQVVVERVNPKLAKFAFSKKGAASVLGTRRFHDILENMGR